MTTLDERGAAAARGLRAAVAEQHVATMHEPPARPARRAPLAAAAAILVVLAVAVGVLMRTGGPDAATPRVARFVHVPAGSSSIPVATDGGLWVASRCPGQCRNLRRIDPGTGRVLAAFAVPGTLTAVADAGGSVWVASALDEPRTAAITRLDPDTGRVLHTWRMAAAPTDIVAARGDVWALDAAGDRVLRIDPSTNELTTVALRTGALGTVDARQLLVVDHELVVVSGCCAPRHGYGQVGTVEARGRFGVFYSTKGPLVAATDGTDLWVSDTVDAVTRFPGAEPGLPSQRTYEVDDVEFLAATRRTVWVFAPGAAGPRRIVAGNDDVAEVEALPAGSLDLRRVDAATDGDRVWLLDGARGLLYELRDGQ
jgi:streptogramin lyase